MLSPFHRKLVLLVACIGLLAGSFLLTIPRTAAALPASSSDCTYYSDATRSTEVGFKFVSCSGQIFIEGTLTAYKICNFEACSTCNRNPYC